MICISGEDVCDSPNNVNLLASEFFFPHSSTALVVALMFGPGVTEVIEPDTSPIVLDEVDSAATMGAESRRRFLILLFVVSAIRITAAAKRCRGSSEVSEADLAAAYFTYAHS